MAIDWSHLPKDVISKICFCTRAGHHDGWGLDQATGYWVHGKCGKPSPMTCVAECDTCGKIFVPKHHDKIKMSFLGIECDVCDPPS